MLVCAVFGTAVIDRRFLMTCCWALCVWTGSQSLSLIRINCGNKWWRGVAIYRAAMGRSARILEARGWKRPHRRRVVACAKSRLGNGAINRNRTTPLNVVSTLDLSENRFPLLLARLRH